MRKTFIVPNDFGKMFYKLQTLGRRVQEAGHIVQNEGQEITEEELYNWTVGMDAIAAQLESIRKEVVKTLVEGEG
jgi:hypothetical protein